ncbi:hypothetical protein OAL32_01965 [Synechococcus sp. AH-551-G15]|nr:hypothetical protein [Synechococcus sp. AH-551-G15]
MNLFHHLIGRRDNQRYNKDKRDESISYSIHIQSIMNYTQAKIAIEDGIYNKCRFLLSWEHPITKALIERGEKAPCSKDGIELIERCFFSFQEDDIVASNNCLKESVILIDSKCWDAWLDYINL